MNQEELDVELNHVKKVVWYENKDGQIRYGIVKNSTVFQLKSDFNAIADNDFVYDGIKIPLDKVKILIPVEPGKVINFGWTFAGHAKETGGIANLTEPFLFLKPSSSLIADKEEIKLPPCELTSQVEFEGEIALIIGRRGKNINEADALSHVLGYTIFNDVTARDLTKTDPQFTRAKGFDTFGPIGPWIVTGLDPCDLRLITTLNGKIQTRGKYKRNVVEYPFSY